MYIPSLCIHLPISGHLGCFCLLAIVNDAAMNIVVQIPIQVPTSNSFMIYSEVTCLSFVHVPLSPSLLLCYDPSVGSAPRKQDEGCPPLPSHPVSGNVHHHCPIHRHWVSGLPAVWR